MAKEQSYQMLIFSCNDNLYAIEAKSIERVLRAVETTPVPNSPFILYGIFDLQGMTVPVFSLRRLLSLPEKSIELEDMIIVFHAGKKLAALLTDSVAGVFECVKDNRADAGELFGDLDLKEIIRWQEKLLPVLDIGALIDEEIYKHAEKSQGV